MTNQQDIGVVLVIPSDGNIGKQDYCYLERAGNYLRLNLR